MAERALQRLRAARARLLMERPFIGALVVHLPLVPMDRCRTTATDARHFYFNPAFIESLEPAAVQFVLAHEALHCALLHHHRRGFRTKQRWDAACDYAVNQLLVDDGLKAPMEALLDSRFRGLTAEAIYPLLDAHSPGEPLDEHWFGQAVPADLGALSPPPVAASPGEPADADREMSAGDFDELLARAPAAGASDLDDWRHRLAASALEAAQAGRLGPHWQSVLSDLAQPRLPWRALLARFLAMVARDDYSFTRPGRREGAAILPGMASGQVDLILALDTSGSIGRSDFCEFIDEIDALKSHVRARITLLACDADIAAGAPWIFEPWQRLELPESLAGGGGTRFTPVFEWVAAAGVRPDALLYFTDALGDFPDQAPDYPVLWLVRGNAPVPFGERVQLNG